MYGVVLMAALTAGGQTADHHGCFSSGNCYGSCYGNYGIDSWNCYGGGYGNGWGGCHGYGSCWGGCYGASWGGCNCGYGLDWSSYGCNGCWGAYREVSPYFVEPPAVAPTAPPTKPGEALPPPSKPPEAAAPSRARLIVDAPADAKLYIDDTAMKTTSEHRAFQTPDLEPGQTYFYEVRVETQRDGKPISATKRVLVRAGQEVHADFTDMATTSTAQAK